MTRVLKKNRRTYCLLLLLSFMTTAIYAQQDSLLFNLESYSVSDTYYYKPKSFQYKLYRWKMRRDSIRATQKVHWTLLGGPSYSSENSLGLTAAVLLGFRLNKQDTISHESYAPFSVAATLNGTLVLNGSLALFMKEDKIRLSVKYMYRKAPSHYFGCGYETIEQTERSDSTTKFRLQKFQILPYVQYEVLKNMYAGAMVDFQYIAADRLAKRIEADAYFNKFSHDYRCVGYGFSLLYDTRNDIATATSGFMLSGLFRTYGKYVGSNYDYSLFELEYKHFQNIFRPRSTLAWTAKAQMTVGDVPFTELPTFGADSNLRGFYSGKYRDKSMAYTLIEYRHMFGTPEALERGRLYAKFGFVCWGGCGTIAPDPSGWTKWKWNIGAGLRFQVQPNKNIRLDLGKGIGEKGVSFYMSMTEAF